MVLTCRFALVASAFSLLAACSSAADFKQPIAGFAAATKAASASLAEQEQVLDTRALDGNLQFALAHPNVVRHETPSDCGLGGKRCRLSIRYPDGLKVSLTPTPADSNIRNLMTGLSAYADNLNAIATADTAGEIKTATDAAQASSVALAKAGDDLNQKLGKRYQPLTPVVTAYAAPVAQLVSYGLTKYAEQMKVEALRGAVARVDAIFPTLTLLFSEVSKAGMEIRRDNLRKEFLAAETAYDADQSNRAKLVAYQEKAANLDAVLVLDPAATFVALRKAHGALNKELNAPEPDFNKMWSYLTQVGSETAKLAAIIQALQKAGQST